MKQLIITIAALLLLPLTVTAQYEEDTENGVVITKQQRRFYNRYQEGGFRFQTLYVGPDQC